MSNKRKFTQEKPDECIVCRDSLDNNEESLICGHWIHLKCLQRHFKAECPICRHPLNIVVSGHVPSPYFPEEVVQTEDEVGFVSHPSRIVDFVRRRIVLPDVVERNSNIVGDDLPDLEDAGQESGADVKEEDEKSNVGEDEDDNEGDQKEEEHGGDLLEDYDGIAKDDLSWRQKGFTHREEDEEYDEENPYGDDVGYEDI